MQKVLESNIMDERPADTDRVMEWDTVTQS